MEKPFTKTSDGFLCVKKLVAKALTSVKKKARRRFAYATADIKPYQKLNPESKKKVLKTAREGAARRKQEDPEKKIQSNAASYKKHKKKRAEKQSEYLKLPATKKKRSDRRKEDDGHLVRERLRRRLHTALSGSDDRKSASTEALFGCSRNEMAEHLSKQLLAGNKLIDEEVDHIFAISLYDVGDGQQQGMCMNYTNCQPLTRQENAAKSNKLPTKDMAAKVDPVCWPTGITMDMLPDIYPGWSSSLRM
tara:strand:+ start:409 stop:1155 length:747 start_codon:yes stop_codon:yes gene_type:complete